MAYATFPLFPVVDGVCTCSGSKECKSPGKHPMVAFSRLEQGEQWGGPEGCGYGIATGRRSGIFVVDVDIKDGKNGLETLRKLGSCPSTRVVQTPTGGFHFYFKCPTFPVRNSVGAVGPGVDIRGEGGFVVAPGSYHRNGKRYEVLRDEEPADAPEWLLALTALRGQEVVDREEGELAPIPIDIESTEGQARIKMAAEYLESCPPAVMGGNGSAQMFKVAVFLVRTLELPLNVAFEAIAELYNDRCEPPWTAAEIAHKLTDARDKVESPPGPAPKDWQENLKAPAAYKQPRGSPASYVYTPGETPASSEMRKQASAEIAYILAGGSPAWEGVLTYDEFLGRVWAKNPPLKMDAETESGLSDDDIAHIRMWFQSNGITSSKEDIADGIRAAAQRKRFHPIRDYLNSCIEKVQPEKLLKSAAERIFQTKDKWANDFFRKMMIGACRRIFEPGTQFDNMLVLYGPDEGEGKTSFVRTLFTKQYSRSQMPDIATKDASQSLQGFWGIEFAELDRILRAESQTTKEFLTRTDDVFRLPYGRADLRFPRQCVFIGTTNEEDFLRAPGRNRRYWPIAVGKGCDIAWLEENRDRLWGEALLEYESGVRHWYTREEEDGIAESRERFLLQDPWYEDIYEYLKGHTEVTTVDVYEGAIARGMADKTRYGRQEQMRVSEALKRIGCKSKKVRGHRGWEVPEELAKDTNSKKTPWGKVELNKTAN